jgi:hypothetical protein
MPHVRVVVESLLARQLGTPLVAGHWKRTVECKRGEKLGQLLTRMALVEPRFSEVIGDGQRLRPGILLLYNGRALDLASVAQLEPADGDSVAFYPIIFGG